MKKSVHAKSYKATKEQLIEAANRLLSCFENLDKWPKLSVAISGKTWYAGSVDDTTKKANNL